MLHQIGKSKKKKKKKKRFLDIYHLWKLNQEQMQLKQLHNP
jgi:hypothetical protein